MTIVTCTQSNYGRKIVKVTMAYKSRTKVWLDDMSYIVTDFIKFH